MNYLQASSTATATETNYYVNQFADKSVPFIEYSSDLTPDADLFDFTYPSNGVMHNLREGDGGLYLK